MKDNKEERGKMKNITINLPQNYEKNIQFLISKKIIASRSEAIRTALREFLYKEYEINLELLEFFENNRNDQPLKK